MKNNPPSRTLVREIASLAEGATVRLCGWADTIRDQKNVQFVILRDHTGKVQLVNEPGAQPEVAKVISQLTIESAIVVTGRVTFNKGVKLGGVEIKVDSFEVANAAPAEAMPIAEDSSLDIRLDWRFLDLRQPKNLLIFQVQTTAEAAMREFWVGEGFIEIHSPKLMGAPSESGAELFTLEYFEGKAYLAQSPQFYKQMAMAAGFDRVFEIGPVFRANPSFTSRHDTEFTSVDVEMSWINSHEDIMALEERWLRHVLSRVAEKHGDAVREHFGVEITVPELPFPKVTIAEAYKILEAAGTPVPLENAGDLHPEGERTLCAHFKAQTGHDFVFVTDYPINVRPFYHMRHAHAPETTKSFDLLWKGLEVTTGAQREHRYDVLFAQAREKGLTGKGMEHYLESFRYGMPPHGGYGFGLTRMLMIMLGVKNVREVTYLYRGPKRLAP